MKTLPKTLPLVIALCVLPLLAPLARAQQQRSEADQYEERKRFPVVRNVFRQIRSDVRYHFGALRETASGIGHDVKSTIRGERPPRGAAQNQYGYRSVPAPPGQSSPTGQGADEYEEPSPPRYPTVQQQQQPLPGRAGPRIEAPENLPRPDQAPVHTHTGGRSPQDPLTEVPELERLPEAETETDSEPAPKPSSQPESSANSKPNPEAKPEAKPEPVIGKVEYPEAKRSDRAGFHYSPYAPYELLDTRGIEPGALAKDPGNGNIFRLPK